MGKRKLEAAINKFKNASTLGAGVNITVTWKPFFLSPNMPARRNKLDHYKEKFGAAQTARIVPHMQSVDVLMIPLFIFHTMVILAIRLIRTA